MSNFLDQDEPTYDLQSEFEDTMGSTQEDLNKLDAFISIATVMADEFEANPMNPPDLKQEAIISKRPHGSVQTKIIHPMKIFGTFLADAPTWQLALARWKRQAM
jgi:hypothetical protein